jgi:hypothetical protein
MPVSLGIIGDRSYQGRIQGVLAYKMGQQNVLMAYPFHFHLLGTISDGSSYIRGSSIFNSYFRGASNCAQ